MRESIEFIHDFVLVEPAAMSFAEWRFGNREAAQERNDANDEPPFNYPYNGQKNPADRLVGRKTDAPRSLLYQHFHDGEHLARGDQSRGVRDEGVNVAVPGEVQCQQTHDRAAQPSDRSVANFAKLHQGRSDEPKPERITEGNQEIEVDKRDHRLNVTKKEYFMDWMPLRGLLFGEI